MSLKGKKFLALIVVFSLVIAKSPLTAGEKKGANVIVMKKNGQEIIGELILVRKDTLVLIESETMMTIPKINCNAGTMYNIVSNSYMMRYIFNVYLCTIKFKT